MDAGSLDGALAGVDVAYYLVHSMASGTDYRGADRRGAATFARAARAAGVGRIVYLGGLGHGDDLSPHLASRQEVGRTLASSGVPTLELRASIVIGSGSTSFEMIRALVDRLPVMVTPRWVSTLTQPIAIEDVLAYLAEAARVPLPESRVVEIGGPDRVSYRELMRLYARRRGLRRVMVPVPVLTPWLSSLWLGLLTPIYARVGRELVEGLRNETVVRDPGAAGLFSVRPRGAADAIDRALQNEDREFASTRWSDAMSSGPAPRAFGGAAVGSRLVDSRSARVPVSPAAAFAPIRRIGGTQGWYYADPLWRLRGLLDLPFGGAGRAARPPPSRPAAPGRHGGLLARGGHRARPPPAAVGRDDPAGARLAAVRGRAGGRRVDHPADRDLRPGGPPRAPLLVRDLAVPRPGLPRHGPRHRAGGRETSGVPRRPRPWGDRAGPGGPPGPRIPCYTVVVWVAWSVCAGASSWRRLIRSATSAVSCSRSRWYSSSFASHSSRLKDRRRRPWRPQPGPPRWRARCVMCSPPSRRRDG